MGCRKPRPGNLNRLAGALVSIWLATTLIFALIHWLPGDPAREILGENAASADVARLRHALGLDRPLLTRYLDLWRELGRGSLGRSLETGEPVLDRIVPALSRTAMLALAALAVAWPLGLAGGIAAIALRRRFYGRAITLLAIVGTAVPAIVTGPLLIDLLAVRLGILPVSGAGGLRHLVLPTITLALAMAPHLLRITQAVVEEELPRPYILLAQAKGVGPWRVAFHHALPTAAPVLIALGGIQWGNLLTGAIVVETMFSFPGMGYLLTRAIGCRDYPSILGCSMVFTAVYLGIGLGVDVLGEQWRHRRYSNAGGEGG